MAKRTFLLVCQTSFRFFQKMQCYSRKKPEERSALPVETMDQNYQDFFLLERMSNTTAASSTKPLTTR